MKLRYGFGESVRLVWKSGKKLFKSGSCRDAAVNLKFLIACRSSSGSNSSAKLLLPTASPPTVTAPPTDSTLAVPIVQTASISDADDTVAVALSGVALGEYTILAEIVVDVEDSEGAFHRWLILSVLRRHRNGGSKP